MKKSQKQKYKIIVGYSNYDGYFVATLFMQRRFLFWLYWSPVGKKEGVWQIIMWYVRDWKKLNVVDYKDYTK